ncbi:MFS transporter [Cellulomonas cellasea]|uniref:DHA1 family L-arabinose/isopropyl-beta-D-thiogalactopyranoside export protein-like MFS transporter/DHA1 family inner membrane transport protein n=1 Tax=Cellulomonas cellasea TaxID=43670 RepID=A0A7W4UDX6_9CELL|nr:MFS transporter [Cellulomonas cellasea]MBB2922411.1 DHA1 family L-arabinose/isopropyl-beta-D-thiogalactopyranoside export protein-like MFS transporter/DHA1 family inner membrane transport protein [Cellulomonas cellasea]
MTRTPPGAPAPVPPLVPPRRAHLALAVLAAGAFCFVTTETLPSGLLTLIARGLDRSVSATGQLVTAYAAVVVVFSLPLTRLTTRVPRRGLLTVTLAVFSAATLLAAWAPTFEVLLAARVLSGLAHALFWSVAAAAATGLFPPEVRGRMVARLSVGSALGPVLGVPAGTWVAQQTQWRVAFLVLGVLSVLLTLAVLALLPSHPPEQGGAARALEPSRPRYVLLLGTTGLAVAGGMAVLTYLAPFVIDHVGVAEGSLSLVLAVSGAAGVVGTTVAGRFLDRRPWPTLVVVLAGLGLAHLGLGLLGGSVAVAVACFGLAGACFGGLATTLMHRGLQHAPGNTDLAMAGVSTAFNVGIGAGALLGGRVVATWGVQGVPLLGASLVLAALVLVVTEPRLVAGREADRARGRPGSDGLRTQVPGGLSG